MFDFSGKVAFVTGAAGNLGAAVAHTFFDAGATVVAVDRATDRLEAACSDIAAGGPHTLLGGIDLSNPTPMSEAIETTLGKYGQIDILVNTVGGYRAGKPLHETALDTFDFMIMLNARTVFIACQAVIPTMLAQGSGKIVNVAAKPGYFGGTRNNAAYSASKAAVVRLTESMSHELRAQNINVNAILPGTIDTPQNREAMPNADYSKWVAPEALADVISFLASDAARAVHGASVPVFGLAE